MRSHQENSNFLFDSQNLLSVDLSGPVQTFFGGLCTSNKQLIFSHSLQQLLPHEEIKPLKREVVPHCPMSNFPHYPYLWQSAEGRGGSVASPSLHSDFKLNLCLEKLVQSR